MLCFSGEFRSLASSFADSGTSSLEVSSRLNFGGTFAGDLWAVVAGESGAGGGGGGLIEIMGSFHLPFSSEALFRSFSKNLDFTMQPLLCLHHKEWNSIKMLKIHIASVTQYNWQLNAKGLRCSLFGVQESPHLLNCNQPKKLAGNVVPSLLQFSFCSDIFKTF